MTERETWRLTIGGSEYVWEDLTGGSDVRTWWHYPIEMPLNDNSEGLTH